MLWFFLAMVAYPDKQRKCQEELDTVVGRSRMPTFEDRDKLPYMKATVRELLRWRPIAPVGGFSMHWMWTYTVQLRFLSGVPHVTKQVKTWCPRLTAWSWFFCKDDWYQGYLIPKGTSCYAHIWYLSFDSSEGDPSYSLSSQVYESRSNHLCGPYPEFSFLHGVSYTTSKGPDADDFNPDRFINEHGQLSPALADTKDGMLLG
jgi:hypothetical protein